MSDCALPPHLKNKLHNDWPWPFSKMSRGSNAFGPRCPKDSKSYRPWPPKLESGFDITRWENGGSSSILFLPDLVNKEVSPQMVYSREHRAIEMNPGNENFKKEMRVFFPFWGECKVHDEITVWEGKSSYIQIVDPNYYSPSALQQFSFKKGYLKLKDPEYTAYWRMIKKKYWPYEMMNLKPDAEDTVAFYRTHYRPDHLDVYYNGPGPIQIGYLGLHWE